MAFNTSFFSPKGDLFAHTSPDGCIRIWDTSSNVLKQEFTPSAHLSATCSAVAWCPCKHNGHSPSKRIKRGKFHNVEQTISDLNLIALGTCSGDVLLYSVSKGDLHSTMSGGHSDIVNGLSWLAEEDTIFTCSKDTHIVRWSISKGSVTKKWKAEKTSISSIAVIDNNNLLTASNSILWWNIKTQSIIKKFTGHVTEIFRLVPIRVAKNAVEINYFISSATNDRVINVWQLDEDGDSNAIASFALSEEPVALDISENVLKQQPLVLSVVTRSGVFQLFQHQLNGKLKKPLSPVHTVCIASMAQAEQKSEQIPVLSAKYLNSPASFILTYGSFLNPVFEIMNLDLPDKETFLIREKRAFCDVTLDGFSNIRAPERPSDAKLLAPGYMTPAKPTEKVSSKKKRKNSTSKELPMEERLNAIYLGQTSQDEKVQEAPTSNSLVHILLQGLQSKDNHFLDIALQSHDDQLIISTVKRLPLNSIPLLITELHKRLTKKGQSRPCLRWLKGVFSVHLSYLMSLQNVDEFIGPVSQLIEAREETFAKMCQLKGFLDILWSQVDSKIDNTEISSKALTEYCESSSEEEEDDEIEVEMEHDKSYLEKILNADSSSSEEDEILLKSSEDEMDL